MNSTFGAPAAARSGRGVFEFTYTDLQQLYQANDLALVLRAGVSNLCGIGWGRGLVLMGLGGPVMSLISYIGFLFVPLGHGSVIQPSTTIGMKPCSLPHSSAHWPR